MHKFGFVSDPFADSRAPYRTSLASNWPTGCSRIFRREESRSSLLRDSSHASSRVYPTN